MADTKVHNRTERSRYEIEVEGRVVGFADYRVVGDRVLFPHTVIDSDMRGQGLGEILVRGALDDLRASGRTAVPQCWFFEEFIRTHPEYADLASD